MTAAAVVLALALALLLVAIDRGGVAVLQARRALLGFDPYGHLLMPLPPTHRHPGPAVLPRDDATRPGLLSAVETRPLSLKKQIWRDPLDLLADTTSYTLWLTLTIMRIWAPVIAICLMLAGGVEAGNRRVCWTIVGKSEGGFIVKKTGNGSATQRIGWCERQPNDRRAR